MGRTLLWIAAGLLVAFTGRNTTILLNQHQPKFFDGI